MITKIEIDGFKSFRNFEMGFTPFTVIAGLNASGKSNLFDALELLSRLAKYSLREAFPDSRGTVDEVFSRIGKQEGNTISFAVEMLVNRVNTDNWKTTKTVNSPRLRYELKIERIHKRGGYEELVVTHEVLSKIKPVNDQWAKAYIPKEYTSLWKSTQAGGSSKPFIQTIEQNGIKSIVLRQDSGQGGKNTPANIINQTVLSSVNANDFPHVFAAKMEMINWRFLQLNPEELRKPTTKDAKMSDIISHNGANLAAALYRIKEECEYNLTEISRELTCFLPEYIAVDVVNDDANKQFVIMLTNKNGERFSSRVLSEGTLRLLALAIIQFDDMHKGLLCFEEPENGIHPARIKQMAQLLYNLSADYEDEISPLRQVIVNTHSPILINELLKWEKDKNVSVWFSKMVTSVIDYNNKKETMRISKIQCVPNNNTRTIFSNPEGELGTVADLEEYLKTINAE